MSGATQELVDRLSPLQGAFHRAFTESQADSYMDSLQASMRRTGLVWTDEAHEMAAADLLARNSLQELAEQGIITADSLTEAAYRERAARETERAATQAAQRAAEEAAARETEAAERAAAAQERHADRVKWLARAFDSASSPADRFINKIAKMGLSFFTVRKLLRYVTNAIARAPDTIAGGFTKLRSGVSDTFARGIVSMMDGMTAGVDRFNKAMDSPAGQKFARGLETSMRYAGQAVGFLCEKGAQLVEWLGDNYQTAMTVAAIVAGIFAAKMLLAAGSTAAASLPLLAMIGLTAAFVMGLQSAGVTSEEIFQKIGQGAGWLYALGYNLVADGWNLIASFAEFFANVFDDPLDSVARLFIDVFDTIVGVVETAAKAIDALMGSNLASAVSGFRSKLQSWADDTFGAKKITFERMEKISNADVMADWGNRASNFTASLSDISLSNATAQNIKAISDDVSSIKKTVSMSDEDIKMLVDIAERRYVNNINLTSQAPVIQVSGQNTGNTAADRQAIANAIRDVLIEQTASGSVVSTAHP